MAWPTVSDRIQVFDVEIFGRGYATDHVCRAGDFDFNLVFRIKAKDLTGAVGTLDVSGATSWTLVTINPEGIRTSYTLTDRDAANGLVEDLVVAGTLDTEGPWILYVDIDWDGASKTSTNICVLHVEGANYRAPEKKNELDSWCVISHDPAAAAADKILYVRNDRTTGFVIDSVYVSAVESVLWKMWQVTGTAAGSSVLTASAADTGSQESSRLTARGAGAITGLTEKGQIGAVRTVATGHAELLAMPVIVGPGDAISIEYDTGTSGVAEVSLRGEFA